MTLFVNFYPKISEPPQGAFIIYKGTFMKSIILSSLIFIAGLANASSHYFADGSFLVNGTAHIESEYTTIKLPAYFDKIPTLVVSISGSSDKTLSIQQCIPQHDYFTCYFNKKAVGPFNTVDYIAISN